MAKKDLWLKPHNISADFWWYEEPSGIVLVFYPLAGGPVTQTIPWRAIRAALRRKDKS